jgi:lysophospholipase L1-like esterase
MSQIDATAARSPKSRRRRLTTLICAGIVVIAAALGYRHYWHARPMGSGPAGPTVSREGFAGTWSERSVLLVGIGDSVTAGYGAPPRHGYFDRLAANPDDEFPEMKGLSLSQVLPNLKVQNLALSGSNSIECLDVLVPRLERQDEKTYGVVVMTTGGNDIIHHYGRTPPREGAMYGATLEQARPWIDDFAKRLDSILDRIEEKFPGGCRFFIANIYDPTDGIGDTFNAGLPKWSEGLDVLAAYNRIIADAATRRKNVHLIDMHGGFLGHGIHCLQFWRNSYRSDDPHYWYWDNLEDPNDRGYDALRRLFLIEMGRILPVVMREEQ